MTPAIALAIIGSYDKTVELVGTMLEKASPEDAAKLIGMWVEREAWWQENVWRQLGEWIEKMDTES